MLFCDDKIVLHSKNYNTKSEKSASLYLKRPQKSIFETHLKKNKAFQPKPVRFPFFYYSGNFLFKSILLFSHARSVSSRLFANIFSTKIATHLFCVEQADAIFITASNVSCQLPCIFP